MKNFSDVLIDNQQQIIANPYTYATPQVQQQIMNGILSKISTLIIGSTLSSIITAPLQTIVSSMQLSVLPHKDIYVSAQSRTKQLARLNTQLTIAEKRNLQLMIRTGGQFQPYTAPVYTGYQQAVRNLHKQGWKAFFKGLSFRVLHQLPHFLCFSQFFRFLSQTQNKSYSFTQTFLKSWGLLAFINGSFNMLHMLQNRYILQNNINQFRVFRNVFRVIGKMWTRGQIFTGISYHASNSFVQLLFRAPLYLTLFASPNLTQIPVGLYYIGETIMYPISTAYKRIVCQSTAIPGMIPLRYSGIGHAMKVIAFQQKLWGLYRGFGLYQVNILARLLILQFTFRHIVVRNKSQF